MQGNCSDWDAVAALDLAPEVSTGLLTLKPYQCLLVTHESFLTVTGTAVWIDNVYVKLTRQIRTPNLQLISLENPDHFTARPQPGHMHATHAGNVVFTNITFHSTYHRGAIGVALGLGGHATEASPVIMDGAMLPLYVRS